MSTNLKCAEIGFITMVSLVLIGECRQVATSDRTVQSTRSPISYPTTTYVPHHTGLTTPWPTAIDRGLLYGNPCDPPCWEGITPSVSSEGDVVRVLDQLEMQGKIERRYSLSNAHYELQLTYGGVVDIIFDNGHVSNLMLSGFNHQVKQILDRFGEPEAYAHNPGWQKPDGCSCENWDDANVYTAPPSVGGVLLYPSRGETFIVIIPYGYTTCLCPDMKIQTLIYYSHMSWTDVWQDDRHIALGGSSYSSKDLVQWHGYGNGY